MEFFSGKEPIGDRYLAWQAMDMHTKLEQLQTRSGDEVVQIAGLIEGCLDEEIDLS